MNRFHNLNMFSLGKNLFINNNGYTHKLKNINIREIQISDGLCKTAKLELYFQDIESEDKHLTVSDVLKDVETKNLLKALYKQIEV